MELKHKDFRLSLPNLNVFGLIILFHVAQSGYSQEEKSSQPLAVLSHLEGKWQAPDSIIAKFPYMQGRGAFKFELDENMTHMKIYEGFSLTDDNDYHFIAHLYPNPLTGTFDFMGSNLSQNFLFIGQYKNVTADSFLREYKVYYPQDSQMAKTLGQVVEFRENFIFESKAQLSHDIKYYNKKSKKWEDWSPTTFTLIKMNP